MDRILLIEDDTGLTEGLAFALEREGYAVETAGIWAEASCLWRKATPDLIILDVGLPDGSGFELCREIRSASRVPIVFLTARDEETDVVRGLDLGGDDYITKPFKLAVLLSRVRAHLRRSQEDRMASGMLCSRGIQVDSLKRIVKRDGAEIRLTASEYRLLCYLMENAGIVLTPQQILSALWDGEACYADLGTLTVYIRRLRAKIEDDPGRPERIVTVRGQGYRWSAEG